MHVSYFHFKFLQIENFYPGVFVGTGVGICDGSGVGSGLVVGAAVAAGVGVYVKTTGVGVLVGFEPPLGPTGLSFFLHAITIASNPAQAVLVTFVAIECGLWYVSPV
jgi:hypothetical protein